MTARDDGFLDGDQLDSFLAPVPKFAMRHVVGIAFGSPGQRPVAVASATAVEIADGRFLATAKHVIDSSAARAAPWRLLVPRRDTRRNVFDRVYLVPTLVPASSADVVWRSAQNDVALLKAPAEVDVDFFPGKAAAELTSRVRRQWDRMAEKGAYYAGVVTGVPSFARDASSGLGT